MNTYIRGTIIGLGMMGAVSAHASKPLLLKEHTRESYQAVMDSLMIDLTKMSDGCADDFVNIAESLYSEIIKSCFSHYREGGYLNVENYALPFSGEGRKKPKIQDYTHPRWLKYMLRKNPEFSDILRQDLKVISDKNNYKTFTSISRGETKQISLKEEHIRAYDLFVTLEEYNFSIDLFRGFTGMLIRKIIK